jgi:hypothetical protein
LLGNGHRRTVGRGVFYTVHAKATYGVSRVECNELAGEWLSLEFGSWKTVQLGTCSEISDSQWQHEAVNMEVEGSMASQAVTRQQLVKTWRTQKT